MAKLNPLMRRLRRAVERVPVRSRGRTGDPPKVYLLVMHAYGMGGTIRAVLNTAEYLARTYDVEIISIVRRVDRPFFALPPGVKITTLVDVRQRRLGLVNPVRRLFEAKPTQLIHPDDRVHGVTSMWTDIQLRRKLRSLGPGVLITSRASFNLIATRLAPEHVRTVGAEHLSFRRHTPELRERLRRRYRKLDALVVLTRRDRAEYRELLGSRTRIVRIPNAVPELPGDPAQPRGKVVVAAGRLTPLKGFDLLIEAFDKVSREEPEWTLRIFGRGTSEPALRAQINERGLNEKVFLMGATDRIGEELCKASIFVLSSRSEGFGIALLEAMSKGLATVSFRVRGPAAIVTDGSDGLLVARRDTTALADGILRLIRDPQLRDRLGTAAMSTAQRYSLEGVGQRWEKLVGRLMPGMAKRPGG